jgi:hypothetical protein
MARRVRVRLVRSGMRDLLHDPGVVEDLRTRADRVLGAAESTAPRDTGAYRESLEVRVVDHGDRTVSQVHATVAYAQLVESRTHNLARALDAGLT